MKLATHPELHLTYCTNIHPGESWQQVFANLNQFIPPLKARLSPHSPFGIGLRLANAAAQELLSGNALQQFQAWLEQHELYVFTLNGFPYGGFHHQVVKDQVYAPDWSQRLRLDYTLRLVTILAALLPADMDGGISTVPLSYKPWWQRSPVDRELVLVRGSQHLALLAAEMARIQEATGTCLHLDLEPEPDGFIENTAEVIAFFQQGLLPIGGAYLAQHLGIGRSQAEAMLLHHIRVCYDTCHFAVAYEDPNAAIRRLQAAGIQIGKLQLSAALQVNLPAQVEARRLIAERLHPFAESTYLHQVIERWTDGSLHHYPDLALALPDLARSPAQEWRTHFHVPIFIDDYAPLQSTQDHLTAILNLLHTQPISRHLEIETYTWDVLPQDMKLDLLSSIAREYEWVLATLTQSTEPSAHEQNRRSECRWADAELVG